MIFLGDTFQKVAKHIIRFLKHSSTAEKEPLGGRPKGNSPLILLFPQIRVNYRGNRSFALWVNVSSLGPIAQHSYLDDGPLSDLRYSVHSVTRASFSSLLRQMECFKHSKLPQSSLAGSEEVAELAVPLPRGVLPSDPCPRVLAVHCELVRDGGRLCSIRASVLVQGE